MPSATLTMGTYSGNEGQTLSFEVCVRADIPQGGVFECPLDVTLSAMTTGSASK